MVLWGTAAASRASAASTDVRLRIAWGGGLPRAWHGTISVRGGRFAEPSLLGLEADESRSVVVDGDAIHIQSRAPRPFAGLDITLQAPTDATISVELAPVDQPTAVLRRDTTLGDLMREAASWSLDERDNRLMLRRAPGDELRISLSRDAMVFSPGERLEVSVVPHELGVVVDSSWRCRVQLQPVRSDSSLWSNERALEIDSEGHMARLAPFSIELPNDEGAYELVVTLSRKRLRDALVGGKTAFERRVQFVVVGRDPPPPGTDNWSVVGEINPADPGWMEWFSKLPKLPLWPSSRVENLGNAPRRQRSYEGQTLSELGPGNWHAFPLPVSGVGRPHVLEVEYPSDIPQTLAISVIEPNAAGQVMPVELDSGVDVPDSLASEKPRLLRHRLVFWPRTKTPLVLLVNRRSASPALFGRLRVLAGPERLAAGTARPQPGERLVAAWFDKPLFPENFTAGEALDGPSGRSVDDWKTFYDGGVRLVEYLEHAGYNSAAIAVLCEGSTLYPTSLVWPTPKYDSGIYFSLGQDPMRKDVLELLYRLFDRSGLRLIPMLQFNCPLPELEAIRRRGGAESVGIELLGGDGQSWLDRHPANRGQAPYYNPLDPRVQAAIGKVVQELAERYGHHASFQGVVVELGGECYTALPGAEWGLDGRTRQRFAEEAKAGGIQAASGTRMSDAPPNAREQTWLAWRSHTLADFYENLASDLTRTRPGACLYLSLHQAVATPPLRQLIHPRLPDHLSFAAALLQLGIDARLSTSNSQIVWLRPQRTCPLIALADQATDIELTNDATVDEYFRGAGNAGTVWVHEPLPLPLPAFDEASPFGRDRTQTYLLTEAAPSNLHNRQRVIHSLAARDVQTFLDGGWMLPLGQEESVAPILATIRHLPARPFTTVHPASSGIPTQPLVVRLLHEDQQTYVYVVNPSPWPVSAELDLTNAADCGVSSLGKNSVALPTHLGDQTTWTVNLEPYDVVAAVFHQGEVEVSGWRVAIDREAYGKLRQELLALRLRATSLQDPKPMNVLANPGFESDPAQLPGWVCAEGPGISIAAESSQPFRGTQALHMTSQGPVAWIRSQPFVPPHTGRISMMVRLRTTDAQRQPPLRLAIEGRIEGQVYYRFAPIGAGAGRKPLTDEWGKQPFLLHLDDLPPGLSELRVGFDLMGAGDVWIDEVEVYDLYFLNTERDELMIQAAVAANHLTNGRLGDCLQLLSGYWPQFLKEVASTEPPRVAAQPPHPGAATSTDVPASSANNKPSMLDRMRNHLPTMILPFQR